MVVKAYIYAEDGALLGFIAYTATPPEVLDLDGRFFEQRGTSREVFDDENIQTFDYCEIDADKRLGVCWEFNSDEQVNVIHICMACGRNASLVWWKCCPDHCSTDGPDVLCQSCVEKAHPNEAEFERS